MNINRIKKNIKKVEEIVENIDVQDVINRMEANKEDSIEELGQRLEELYRTQQARLDVGADDLDIREEIAEVEEEIKELQDETIEKNSIEEDIRVVEKLEKKKIYAYNLPICSNLRSLCIRRKGKSSNRTYFIRI